jgi:hypothetical protein
MELELHPNLGDEMTVFIIVCIVLMVGAPMCYFITNAFVATRHCCSGVWCLCSACGRCGRRLCSEDPVNQAWTEMTV